MISGSDISMQRRFAAKGTVDDKMYRKAGKGINQTFFRLRLIVLIGAHHGYANR